VPALASEGPAPPAKPPTYKEQQLVACGGHLHTQAEHAHRARDLYHQERISKAALKRLSHLARCQNSLKATGNAKRLEQKLKRWRRSVGIWKIRFAALPTSDKAWAVSTGECESGNDADANTGNGFLGAFQWVLSTWRSATAEYGKGGAGSPLNASWHEQAVKAVAWNHSHPTGQWPNCP